MTYLPSQRYVIANDRSPSAVAAMRRNVQLNELGSTTEGDVSMGDSQGDSFGRVHVNEADAWFVLDPFRWNGLILSESALMYNHREEKRRVDVVDLDPYGTAAPFLDAAIQSVTDGGNTVTSVLYVS